MLFSRLDIYADHSKWESAAFGVLAVVSSKLLSANTQWSHHIQLISNNTKYFISAYHILLEFLLTVKAATLIFIYGRGSAILSAKEEISGFIYKGLLHCMGN